ncbi:hypothetical protein Tco_1129899 [Tanacetum coccineum]
MNKAITNRKRPRQDQRRRSSNVTSSMLGRSKNTSTLGEIVSFNYTKSDKNVIGLIKSIREGLEDSDTEESFVADSQPKGGDVAYSSDTRKSKRSAKTTHASPTA